MVIKKIDKDNFIIDVGWGEKCLEGMIEIEDELIPREFLDDYAKNDGSFQAWKYEDNNFNYSKDKYKNLQNKILIEELRTRRETECFHVIDKGPFFFEQFNENELKQIKEWRVKWLKVTDTLKVPKKPSFLQ